MNFLEKYNTDDVFFRGIIIGLLSKLNEVITYEQVDSDQSTSKIYIPFFYSMVGDEPFLQDFYLSYEDCDGKPAFAEGNYDVIPRGILEMGAIRIDTGSATTKFVRGSYAKEIEKENGSEMVTYSSYFYPIPLGISINAKIKADTTLDAFKIQQSVLEIIYKRFVYYFYYKGFRIPVQVSLGDAPVAPVAPVMSFLISYIPRPDIILLLSGGAVPSSTLSFIPPCIKLPLNLSVVWSISGK